MFIQLDERVPKPKRVQELRKKARRKARRALAKAKGDQLQPKTGDLLARRVLDAEPPNVRKSYSFLWWKAPNQMKTGTRR